MTAASPASPWASEALPDLLAEHGLSRVREQAFPNDGWSGAILTLLDDGARRFILKRTSWATDWIARSTRDHALREAVLAADPVALPPGLASAHLGAAADGTAAAILMPDLSPWLVPWDRPDGSAVVASAETVDRALGALASIHAMPWGVLRASDDDLAWPWCPLLERLQLLSRPSAERYRAGGLWVGERFLAGWDAFDRLAPPAARDLVKGLAADPSPLIDALASLPSTGLHGDLKLANLALLPDGRAAAIDWQMTAFAPVALDLGWFLVSNVAQIPLAPDAVLEAYFSHLDEVGGAAITGDRSIQRDLAILVGLVLRGWRKGLDAASGSPLPTGAAALDDLVWWGHEAVAAAARRL